MPATAKGICASNAKVPVLKINQQKCDSNFVPNFFAWGGKPGKAEAFEHRDAHGKINFASLPKVIEQPDGSRRFLTNKTLGTSVAARGGPVPIRRVPLKASPLKASILTTGRSALRSIRQPQPRNADEAAALLAGMDTNNDGVVDADELTAATGMSRAQARRTIAMATSGDGKSIDVKDRKFLHKNKYDLRLHHKTVAEHQHRVMDKPCYKPDPATGFAPWPIPGLQGARSPWVLGPFALETFSPHDTDQETGGVQITARDKAFLAERWVSGAEAQHRHGIGSHGMQAMRDNAREWGTGRSLNWARDHWDGKPGHKYDAETLLRAQRAYEETPMTSSLMPGLAGTLMAPGNGTRLAVELSDYPHLTTAVSAEHFH